MELASLIISICTFAWTIIAYILHERTLKKQNKVINQYQIQKIEEEKLRKKCAKISGDIIKENRKMRILVISNKGIAPARNINVTDIRKFKGVFLTKAIGFPYTLLGPEEKIEISFMISESTPDNINIEYTWDDDNKTHNIYKQDLQL